MTVHGHMSSVLGLCGLSIAGDKFEEYKCCGNDAIHFKLGEFNLLFVRSRNTDVQC